MHPSPLAPFQILLRFKGLGILSVILDTTFRPLSIFKVRMHNAEPTDDDLATIYSTQARYATVHGDTSAAIAGYEHSLQILKGVHDGNNPVLGWEYLLLGIAYADANRLEDALREMRQGLSTLDRTWGRKDSRYLEAEIAYSQVLDRSGDHKPAALLRAADEATLKDLQRTKCVGCTISADAFR